MAIFDSRYNYDEHWSKDGSYQAGCFIDLVCHHMRATKLYAESILSTSKFRVDQFNRSMGHYAEIGREEEEKDERGAGEEGKNFYLKTNSRSPFSLSKGIWKKYILSSTIIHRSLCKFYL